jgi:hypothetical protein
MSRQDSPGRFFDLPGITPPNVRKKMRGERCDARRADYAKRSPCVLAVVIIAIALHHVCQQARKRMVHRASSFFTTAVCRRVEDPARTRACDDR